MSLTSTNTNARTTGKYSEVCPNGAYNNPVGGLQSLSDAWCPTLREDGVTPSKAYFHCGVHSSHHPCKLHIYHVDTSWQWNPERADLKEKYSCCEDTVNTFVFSTAEVTHSSQTMTVTRQDGMQWTLTRQSDSRGSCKCGFTVSSIAHNHGNNGQYVVLVFERRVGLWRSLPPVFHSVYGVACRQCFTRSMA